MSSAVYARAAATATRLLAKFGAVAYLRSSGTATYSPATSAATSTDAARTKVDCAVLDYPLRYVDGTLVRVGDRKALVSAPAGMPNPKPGDVLEWEGKDLEVVRASIIAPAGDAVAHELQVRG